MKKILYLTIAMMLAMMDASAGTISEAAARELAARFLNSRVDRGRLCAVVPSGEMQLLYTGMSDVSSGLAAYYIYNTDDSYVVVAGDDLCREILVWGDRPLDLSNMPCGLEALLDTYKHDFDYLQSHPGEGGLVRSPRLTGTLESIPPLLSERWSQGTPYNNYCPVYNGEACVTGCACTSLSMVLHYWQHASLSNALPGYITGTLGISMGALEPVEFDWANMLDVYKQGNYTDQQGAAVARLMQYVGQAEMMDYGPDGSGATVYSIFNAVRLFGYDSRVRLEEQMSHRPDVWRDLIMDELKAGRPIVYTAADMSYNVGHAFNLDGYDAESDMYHINFGWGGNGDAYCALNAFSGGGMTFNHYQQMIVGIQPPEVFEPALNVSTDALDFGNAYNGYHERRTVTVTGKDLTGNITLKLGGRDSIHYSVTPRTITPAEAAAGVEVTVSLFPYSRGQLNATLTLSSPDVDDINISLTGFGIKTGAFIRPNASSMEFEATVGETVMQQLEVEKHNFDGWIASPRFGSSAVDTAEHIIIPITPPTLNSPILYEIVGDECFSVKSCMVTYTSTMTDSVALTVVYHPTTAGTHHAQLILSTSTFGLYPAHPVTVELTGVAAEGPLGGDMNGDGVLTVSDVVQLIDVLVNNDGGMQRLFPSDVNGDGLLNLTDLTILIELVLSAL